MDNIKDLRNELDELRAAQAAIQSRMDKLENKLAVAEAEPEPKSPFARADLGDGYYFVGYGDEIIYTEEAGLSVDYQRYAVANYCTDHDLLQQREWHEELNRLLWRYSEEHGGDAEWDGKALHWSIARSIDDSIYSYSWSGARIQGITYFRTEETAMAAIRDIVEPFLAAHPDFKW